MFKSPHTQLNIGERILLTPLQLLILLICLILYRFPYWFLINFLCVGGSWPTQDFSLNAAVLLTRYKEYLPNNIGESSSYL